MINKIQLDLPDITLNCLNFQQIRADISSTLIALIQYLVITLSVIANNNSAQDTSRCVPCGGIIPSDDTLFISPIGSLLQKRCMSIMRLLG